LSEKGDQARPIRGAGKNFALFTVKVDLPTTGSCGGDTRNITGCPLAGLDGDEICDASPRVLQATELLAGNPAF
jgi:sulfite reductase beta subunit-like hemoprotein